MLEELIGEKVVVDLRSEYVALGTLLRVDERFLELRNADLHDLRDTDTTRELYVAESLATIDQTPHSSAGAAARTTGTLPELRRSPLRPSRSATAPMNRSTSSGSNCTPAQRRSSANASCLLRALQ